MGKMGNNYSTIFISHRDADKGVADVLKKAIRGWGNGQLRIFQSADVRGSDVRVGENLTEKQKNVLSDTDVVLLIYTTTDNDWYYCMWETGLAMDTKGQGTKMVVFQLAQDIPVSLEGQMTVMLNDESIKKFVSSFYKDPNFFPGCHQPINSEIDESTVENKGDMLINELRSVYTS